MIKARPGEQLEAVAGMIGLGAGRRVFKRWARRWGGRGPGEGELSAAATAPSAARRATARHWRLQLVCSEQVRVLLSQRCPDPHSRHQDACTALNCNGITYEVLRAGECKSEKRC